MIQQIIGLIRIIHSETDPRQISLGFALGMIPGLTPLTSLHNLLVLLAILFFRVNIGAAMLSWGVFKILAYALDPLFHQIGLFLLTGVAFLQGLWTTLYNAPLVPYTRFNNSIVMGSLVFSLLAFYPVYWGGRFIVVKYRETLMERFNRLRIVQVFRASDLYKWYSRYSKLKG
ncbi:MAG: TIGR03546 family protein [Desulfobacterales bacterium]|nr:TIGR03546 family protein [Desulfobacterales bacterium]